MVTIQTLKSRSSRWRILIRTWPVFTYICASLLTGTTAQETFTNAACRAVTSAMNSCAKRWDSIRTECTKRVTTNTVWPGPCECAYFANDMPCFDEQEFCAAQVWTQVPQWFRDGVSSCLMKDSEFTIRAQLGSATGSMGNPFTIEGMPGRATRTVDAGVVTGVPAQTRASVSIASATSALGPSDGLSTGAKAGFGVGISIGIILIAIAAFLIIRSRRRPAQANDTEKKREPSLVELHDDNAHIHQLSSETLYPKNELPGSPAPCYELGVRASTYLIELPNENSRRQSRQ